VIRLQAKNTVSAWINAHANNSNHPGKFVKFDNEDPEIGNFITIYRACRYINILFFRPQIPQMGLK